jgi:3-oxoadipate enol-lactonase
MTAINSLNDKGLEHGQQKLHYAASGDPANELIILIHPAFGDHQCFAYQIDALAEKYHVVAIDLPGHGRWQEAGSPKKVADAGPLIGQLIGQQSNKRAHLVGVSLGSLVAQDVAAQMPEVVATLTVVGGYPIFGTSKEVQRAQGGELLKMVFLLLFSPGRFRRYVARSAAFQAQGQELFYRSAQSFTRRSFQALAGTDGLMRTTWQQARHPLQIVVGEHERPLLRKTAEEWHQREPASRLTVVPNAGHCANMDNPAAFNQLLLTFLAQR